MKAIVISDDREKGIELSDGIVPAPNANQVLVKISHAALNRRDQWIREGLYPGIVSGVTLGSDGCGIVEDGVSTWIGKEVIINPNLNWGDNKDVQSKDYSILGLPNNGTFAEYLVVNVDRLAEKPDHLESKEAATLPLAGMTAYRACFTKGNIRKGDKVLIAGAGGGVAQFALQFSVAAGAETYVTSGSFDKVRRCIDLGAKDGVNYKDQEWVNQSKQFAKSGFDVIIDSAGGNSLNGYLKLVKPGGKIVIYGSTTGKPSDLDLFRLFWSQASIVGSTMANDQEFGEMINFVSKHSIKPVVDSVFTYSDYIQAFDRIKSSGHFGKVAIQF